MMDKEKGKSDEMESDAAETSSPGGKRKRSQYNMEPRTPLKRQRIPVQRFQSPLEEQESGSSKSKVVLKEEIVTLFKKGVFLAVRGAEGTFYLCRTLQNIKTGTKKFRIQWLSLDSPPDVYKFDYVDNTDIECVLTTVKMERVSREMYKLPSDEQSRVEKLLNRTLKIESGDIVEEELEEQVENKVDQDGEDCEDVESPSKTKMKTSSGPEGKKNEPAPKGKQKPKTASQKKKEAAQKKKEKEKEKKQKLKEKSKKQKSDKVRGPDRNLKPNPKIKVFEKDPFFEGKDTAPFISVPVQSLRAFNAVANNSIDKMKELIDSDKVYRLDISRSPGVSLTPLDYALKKDARDMVKLLLDDTFQKDNKRLKRGPPHTLLQATGTGEYNPVFLGVRNIRALNVSRGGKEGNNAFAKDFFTSGTELSIHAAAALKAGISPDTLDFFIAAVTEASKLSREDVLVEFLGEVHIAIENGHRKTAAKIVSEAVRMEGYGYNFLHEEVLKFDKEDLRDNILAASVRKKPFDNRAITPLHCAAINPNVKYLTRLLSIEPDIGLMDRAHRRPIHYAAACEGTAPLEFLLQKGANPNDTDSSGDLPLHRACVAGRADNVALLLKHAQSAESRDEATIGKWGMGAVDRPNRSSYCPVHLAVINGHIDVLKVLLKYKVNVNKPLSAGKNRMTPLMLAAEQGNLDIVRLLVQNGATVELADKLKRTALTHAVLNGNTNVASYLLYLGADPNRVDSSGNSLVHYAAAYGWYHCLKLLIKDAGAVANVENDWKTTPLAIAFLKGHIGIVDFLLSLPKTDINFKDEKGMTLVSIAAASRLQPGLCEQIDYLVKEKGADPTITDIDGFSALHHLCANSTKLKGNRWSPQICEDAMDISVRIAETLLEDGCHPSLPNNSGKTPVSLALEKVNSRLVQLLVDRGSEVPVNKNEEEKNILHIMAEQCCTTPMTHLLEILAGQEMTASGDQAKAEATPAEDEKMDVDEISSGGGDASNAKSPQKSRPSMREALKKMSADTDFSGFTPLLRACQVYRSYQVPRNLHANQVEQQQEEGRKFIKALIEIVGADVNATVCHKNIPDAKEPTYTAEGKYSVVHMMVSTQTEMPVKEGDKEEKNPGLLLILSYNPDLELRDLKGQTPLAMVVRSMELRHLDKVGMLLKKGANPNVSFKFSNCGEEEITPIICAAMNKELPLVRLLLQNGACATSVDSRTNTNIMHYLVTDKSSVDETIEVMKMLQAKGVNVNDKTKDGLTALHIAVMNNPGDADASTAIEEFLLAQKANIFAKTTTGLMPIHQVFHNCSGDPIELLSLLTAAMVDKMIDEPGGCNQQTPLHMAAGRGATICCMHLLQRRAQLNRKDVDGNTPLTLAVRNKQDSCAIMLLQQGACVSDEIVVYNPRPVENEKPAEPVATTEEKKKPTLKWRPIQQQQKKEPEEKKRIAHSIFQGAINSDLQGVAHLLLDKMGLGFSAIEAALNTNKFNVVLRLLKRTLDSNKVQGTNKDNQTLLHVLAQKTQAGAQQDLQLKVAEALMQKGVPVNTVDNHGCTPIHYCAIQHQPVPLARLLIENSKNFDVRAKDKLGRDLVSAVLWDYEWVSGSSGKAMAWLDLLLEKGLSLDVLFNRPLPDMLLFGARLDSQCPDYYTTKASENVSPLILAVRNYNFGLARYLLQKGANPNFKDSMGLTPLMHAVKMNDLTMVKLLLNYDYNKDIIDKSVELLGKENKPVLEKQFSRQIFTIRPDKRAEEMEKDPSVDEDMGDDEDENEVEVGIEDEAAELDMTPEDEEDAADDVPINGITDDDVEEEADDDDDDSDHDTDVVDDDDDEHPPPPPELPRLGSKQISLARGASSTRKGAIQTVEKTSTVDLDITDSQGWTAIHHAVCPLDYGTYDNAELIYVLAKAGSSLTKKDHAGLPPLEWALLRGAPRIAQMIQELGGVEVEKQDKPTFSLFEVSDGILSDGKTVNYHSDADNTLAAQDDPAMETKEIKAKCKPDSNCEMRFTGEVYQDEAKGVTYDVTLTKVDVATGVFGMYNFYKLQVIWQKGKNMYVLFTRWGRIGDRGQWQHTPFPSADGAVKEFCKIFRQKTGNDWNTLDKFVNHPKKYRLLPKEESRKKVKEVKVQLKSDVPSKLPHPVQDLLEELTCVDMLLAFAKSKGVDEEVMPFGRIRRDVLVSAHKILQQLEELIKTVDIQQKNLLTTPINEYQSNCEKIATLTNEFYHLVPVGGFEYESIRPIRDKKVLKEHFRLVSDLMDMEVASKILLGSQHRIKEMNPLDYIYRSIGCRIQPLNESDNDTQYILTYINASGHGSRVNAVYKVSRPGEAETMSSRLLGNHRLLWHGSSMANIVSILARGLLVAPFDVPLTGHLFGEGIYFADCFTKSRNYCYNVSGTCKVMLLCEVALGKSMEDIRHEEEDHLDQDVHSLKILGKSAPDADFDITLPFGATMPLGQLKSMTYTKPPLMPYNEYIVHDSTQICIRYLVMFDG